MEKVKKAYSVLQNTLAEVTNITGYLIKAIKDDYTVITKKAKNNNLFNQFPQRNYDFEQLEMEILSDQ